MPADPKEVKAAKARANRATAFSALTKPDVRYTALARTPTIILAGEIYGGWMLEEFGEKLDEAAGGALMVHISSHGGDYQTALAMFNMLSAYEGDVTVRIESMAASAASFVAMAADVIEIAPNAEIMIHNASNWGGGTAAELEEQVKKLREIDSVMATAYARGDDGKIADITAAMIAETTYSAQEAVDTGLADKIVTPDDESADGMADDDGADPAAETDDGAVTAEDPETIESEDEGGKQTAKARASDTPPPPAKKPKRDAGATANDQVARMTAIADLCAVANVSASVASEYIASGKTVAVIRAELVEKTTAKTAPFAGHLPASGAEGRKTATTARFDTKKDWNPRRR